MIALFHFSWRAKLCQLEYPAEAHSSQALATSFDLQCCCCWAKSSWRRRYSSCACLVLACSASTLAHASASDCDCDCGSGSDCGWGSRRSGCTAAAASALHACCRADCMAREAGARSAGVRGPRTEARGSSRRRASFLASCQPGKREGNPADYTPSVYFWVARQWVARQEHVARAVLAYPEKKFIDYFTEKKHTHPSCSIVFTYCCP